MAFPLRFRRRQSGAASTLGARLFLGIFLLAGLFILGMITLYPLWMAIVARTWERTPCRVLSSELHHFSGKGKGTFRVDVTYRYDFGGGTYTSSRYTFMSGGSSAHDWKAQVIAENPPGRQTECFVNPRNPTEAVLDPGPTREIWFGLLGLPFLAIGSMAFLPARKVKRSVSDSAPIDAATYEPAGSDGWRTLKPTARRGVTAVVLGFFALFWNGAITLLVINVWQDWHRGQIQWGLVVFGSLFVIAGLLLLAGAIHAILSLFNPTLRVSASGVPVRLGGTLGVAWEFQGSVGRLRSFTVTLEGAEVATSRRGTSKITQRRVFAEEAIFSTTDRLSMAAGSAESTMPANTMHTWQSAHNAIEWRLHFRGEIPSFPDVNDEFAITVLPLASPPRS